jgi:hypothetical protein
MRKALLGGFHNLRADVFFFGHERFTPPDKFSISKDYRGYF